MYCSPPANWNKIEKIVDSKLPWACDNGCFNGLDKTAYLEMLDKIRGLKRLLWVTCPDVVADSDRTLRKWYKWSEFIRSLKLPIAFVMQDGLKPEQLPFADCYFIGGSTKWKLSYEAERLADIGKSRGGWLHMGRVNSIKRLTYAYNIDCDSIDGTSMSMFGDICIPRFARCISALQKRGEGLL